ncbi:MAG TPA: BREX-1 system phosphatase PglZ type B, partial [Syntrophales bacterium]|nr:BREX-1 system phosphatase PglZ type B [Syntrophales bacterium]
NQEKELSYALHELGKKYQDEAVKSVHALEKAHSQRRGWVWSELGRSQFAVALEYLNRLAALVEKPLAASSVQELGELYAASGWKIDEAALNALACCTSVNHEEPICTAVRSLYLPWLEASARNLQQLVKTAPEAIRPQQEPTVGDTGQVILFVDGLRFDIAQVLKNKLQLQGYTVDCAWDWAPYPGVTATAKPFVSPLTPLLTGGAEIYDFNVAIEKTGKTLTSDCFSAMLEEQGYQILKGDGQEEAEGKAWMEAGAFDRYGHNEGWKMAKRISQEIEDLAIRIKELIAAGWKQVSLVTDHGWLVMPAGFPKIELPKFLVESRWGRCAVMKEMAATDLPVIAWHWNKGVNIATPPGTGCFKAGMEYCHGGLSLQELVVSKMLITSNINDTSRAKITGHKWVGLRCRVSVQEAMPGLMADLRVKSADALTSIVDGKKARDIAADGTVSLPVDNPDNERAAVMIMLLDPQGNVIDQRPTVVGGEQ